MFTQSLYVLTDRLVALDEVARALVDVPALGRQSSPAGEHWAHGSDAWVAGTRHHDRGRIVIDVVHRPFPDDLDTTNDRRLYAAWSMGQFGPMVRPGCLQRALSRISGPISAEIAQHLGFIRLRYAYAVEGEKSGLPRDRDAPGELMALSHLAYFISEFQGALALFDPNGEKLTEPRSVRQEMDIARMMDESAWSLWTSQAEVAGTHGSGMRTMGVGQWYRGDLLIVGPVPEGETSGAVFESYIRQSLEGADPAVLNHNGASIPLRWVVDDRFDGSELAVVSLSESSASA